MATTETRGASVPPIEELNLPDPKISDNARAVLERRYLRKNEGGELVETPKQLFWRVAYNIASAERRYGSSEQQVLRTAQEFYQLLAELKFLPNSPTLMNAGLELQQLSACFVLPVPDTMVGIFDALKNQALIHKSGGGTGFSFSRLRPSNDFVQSTSGVASGPVSFMKIFDSATQQVKQGGKRRGANMGILRVDHPDILTFIDCKAKLDPENQRIYEERQKELQALGVSGERAQAPLRTLHRTLLSNQVRNFNISVAVTDGFMEAWKKGERFDLVSPRTGKACGELDAKEVLDKIAGNAWTAGEPGLFFIDHANATCPTNHIAPIEATNPCGEQDLQPNDSCNLGSIDLDKHLKQTKKGSYEVDWSALERTSRLSTRFLDNVIDMNQYPIPEIHAMSVGNRRIGLGIMGFARMLFKLEIPYDSPEGLAMAEQVMRFVNETAVLESVELAKSRGLYPNWPGSKHEALGSRRRNSYVTTIAPTGTLSMIADTSGGCEPEFSLIWYKNVMDGTHLPYVLEYFIEVAKREGFWSEDLMEKIQNNRGSARGIDEIPEKWQKVFSVSFDVSPEKHVRMQAAFQKHVESQVSKTINLPPEATVEDVKKAYLLAYELGCRGITVYRDGSRDDQVMNVGVSAKTTSKVVVGQTPQSVVTPSPPETTRRPRARPDVVTGTTQKVITGYGALYVTINEDEQGLFEVFAQIGRGGGYTASFTEAVARLVSLCLRSGVPLDEVIDQMEGIRSPRMSYDHQEAIYSVPDAVAKALKRHQTGFQTKVPKIDSFNSNGVETDQEFDKEARVVGDTARLVKKGLSPECPECGHMLVFEEGCSKCLGCGFSEC